MEDTGRILFWEGPRVLFSYRSRWQKIPRGYRHQGTNRMITSAKQKEALMFTEVRHGSLGPYPVWLGLGLRVRFITECVNECIPECVDRCTNACVNECINQCTRICAGWELGRGKAAAGYNQPLTVESGPQRPCALQAWDKLHRLICCERLPLPPLSWPGSSREAGLWFPQDSVSQVVTGKNRSWLHVESVSLI